MKHIYIFIFLFSYVFCSAQDPQLFDNPWYLLKITIDNTEYLPPNNGDHVANSHAFSENPYEFQSGYCASMTTGVTYDNQNTELSLEDDPIFLLGFAYIRKVKLLAGNIFQFYIHNLERPKILLGIQ